MGAVQFGTTGEYVTRAGNFGDLGVANFSFCGWFYLDSAGADDYLCGVSHVSNGRHVSVQIGAGSNLIIATNGGSQAIASAVTGKWFFLGIVSGAAAGTINAYYSPIDSATVTAASMTNDNATSVQADRVSVGAGNFSEAGTQTIIGRACLFRAWDRVQMSGAELMAHKWMREGWTRRPTLFWKLQYANDLIDYAGNGYVPSVTGTIDTVDGVPNLWVPPRRLRRRSLPRRRVLLDVDANAGGAAAAAYPFFQRSTRFVSRRF